MSRPYRPAVSGADSAAAPAADARGGVPGGLPSRPAEVALEPLAPAGLVRFADASTPATGSSPARAVAAEDGERHLRPLPSPAAPRQQAGAPEPMPEPPPHAPRADAGEGAWPRPTCTVAQLRRFIKSRPWVPMHELRRRFGISGSEDDVTPIRVGDKRLYVGMPSVEGRMMAELLGGGDVGYELSLDPDVPVIIGVYPMRPVPRS